MKFDCRCCNCVVCGRPLEPGEPSVHLFVDNRGEQSAHYTGVSVHMACVLPERIKPLSVSEEVAIVNRLVR
jgi:hypothetical protein